MLPFISFKLTPFFGPFRLLSSFLVLIALGAGLAAILNFCLLPKLWNHLPHDQGKAFVKGSEKAKGKPTGAGVIMVSIFSIVSLIIMPFEPRFYGIVLCLFLSMLTGYFDDRSQTPWGQLKKGLMDAVVVILAASFLCGGKSVVVWFPFWKGSLAGGGIYVPPIIYIPVVAFLLWLCINAVNCSDGVDGLAGSLALLTLFVLGGFLYAFTGYNKMAEYLLIPKT